MYEAQTVTRLECLVGIVEKTATSEYSGQMNPVSVRLPIDIAAMVYALSQHSGVSKNKMMVELLDLGIETLWGALKKKHKVVIHELQGQMLAGLQASAVSSIDKED